MPRWLWLACLFFIAADSKAASHACLRPSVTLQNQRMPLGTKHALSFCDLEPNTEYEVRVSYPASMPTVFTMRLTPASGKPAVPSGSLRRLLNTEKLVVRSTSQGVVLTPDGEPAQLSLWAKVEGVASPLAPERKEAVFNIVLDPISAGVPGGVWSLWKALTLALLAAVALVVLLTRWKGSPFLLPASLLEDNALASAAQPGHED